MKRARKIISAVIITVLMLSTVFSLAADAEVLTTTTAANNASVWDGTFPTPVNTPTFSGGSGTENDPWLISSAADLAMLSEVVRAGIKNFRGEYVKLTVDIYLNDTEGWQNWGTNPPANVWRPIGADFASKADENLFAGTFDGDGHAIYGMYCYGDGQNGVDDEAFGLFSILNGTVKNLAVLDSYVYATNRYVGAIAGHTSYTDVTGDIINCLSNAICVSDTLVGGLCGMVGGEISNCLFVGKVIGGTSQIGGIAGQIGSGYASGTGSNCVMRGTVTSTSPLPTRIGSVYGYLRVASSPKPFAGTVTNNYYVKDNNTFGGAEDADIAGGAEGKTLAEINSPTAVDDLKLDPDFWVYDAVEGLTLKTFLGKLPPANDTEETTTAAPEETTAPGPQDTTKGPTETSGTEDTTEGKVETTTGKSEDKEKKSCKSVVSANLVWFALPALFVLKKGKKH
ncbi:MAG: hypothetical protein GX057_00600 [Clostridiales bacterium]|nr:hypothetical protein [Clostridiales bacterium]